MRSLRLVELQRARKLFQNAFGNPAEVPPFEPRVVGDADSGEDRDLLPAQSRNAPGTVRRQTNLIGGELASPGGQELSDLALGVHGISVTRLCLLWETLSVPPSTGTLTQRNACFLGGVPRAASTGTESDHHEAHFDRRTRRLPHRTRHDGDVRLLPRPGAAATTSRSAPSTGRSTWASPTSTPPRSTGPTPTRSSSAGRSRAATTRSFWRRSSGSSRTRATAPGSSTAARRTSAPPSRAPSSGSARTTSISTTSTGSTRTRRSRRPSAPWPSWSPRARSGT